MDVDAYKRGLTLEYSNAVYQRSKRMPRLDAELRKLDPPKTGKSLFSSLVATLKSAASRNNAPRE